MSRSSDPTRRAHPQLPAPAAVGSWSPLTRPLARIASNNVQPVAEHSRRPSNEVRMSPFFGFRLWLRRAPMVERVTATAAIVIAVGLLTWALVPSDTTASADTVTVGSDAGGSSITGQ